MDQQVQIQSSSSPRYAAMPWLKSSISPINIKQGWKFDVKFCTCILPSSTVTLVCLVRVEII